MLTRVTVLLFTITTAVCMVGAQGREPIIVDKPPVRVIQDPYPVFSGIDMDVERSELFVADDNRSSISVYRTNFSPHDRIHEPVRRIEGLKPSLGHVCAVAVSPEHREIYAIAGDMSGDGPGPVRVFPMDASGDVAPSRIVEVDHGTSGIFVDRKNDELFITVEHINGIYVHRRTARGTDLPVRYIQGPKTGLADPQGIFVDTDHEEVFVTNYGHWQHFAPGERYRAKADGRKPAPLSPSTGRFLPPSINVYSRTAHGDVAPLRTIQGSRTGLNLPMEVYLDPVSDQIIVANSGAASVLFFEREANGNVAPVRILEGPATGLLAPTGLFVDTKRNELWVGDWEKYTASVFSRTAQGNVAPLRTIRSAPKGTLSLGFGNIGDVAYDPKRKQILVPN